MHRSFASLRMTTLTICREISLTARRLELFSQSLPALEVLVIELGRLERKFCRLTHEASFEHECHGVAEINRLQFGLARLLEGFSVGAVASHAIVQTGAAGHESFSLGVIFAADQPHELVHEVAMEPGRTERMLGNHPSRRENYEVNIGGSGNFRRRSQDGVDRRVGMV